VVNFPRSYWTPYRLSMCRAAILLLHLCFLAHPAAAQRVEPEKAAGTCFEIISPQRYTQPGSPLLFNRCTGETWLLMANRRDGSGRGAAGPPSYRWVALEVAGAPLNDTKRTQLLAPPSPGMRPHPADEPDKRCFVFTGRRFCE
jgi:hypothetical protein